MNRRWAWRAAVACWAATLAVMAYAPPARAEISFDDISVSWAQLLAVFGAGLAWQELRSRLKAVERDVAEIKRRSPCGHPDDREG